VGVMWRELSACYNACRAGSTAVLPPLPLQFPDYAAWQRRFLTPERLSQQAAAAVPRLCRLAAPVPHPGTPVAAGRLLVSAAARCA
ncbi:hypothetical protein, partial [Erwinia amylovora]|uniref:hypothetical protein n=1 Tax=Erwinia amylovora TaxID=552 RepID=UPI003CFE59F4